MACPGRAANPLIRLVPRHHATGAPLTEAQGAEVGNQTGSGSPEMHSVPTCITSDPKP